MRVVFSRIPPPGIAEPAGPLWTLEGLLNGEFARDPQGDPATWRLNADGIFAGSTGCRTFSGRLTETPEGLVASDVVQDDRGPCPGLQGQDDHVLGVFAGRLRMAVLGDRLTIHGQPGLVYRRGP